MEGGEARGKEVSKEVVRGKEVREGKFKGGEVRGGEEREEREVK